jgi:2-keto-4-pentenoate hydratase/2-oxohepta-3-ene-1,7-dioic acid hydratase in catechol pathway
MIYGIEKLVAYTSTIAEIYAGDILMCGSPAGNGAHWRQWLKPGDTMEGTISRLGVQRNQIQLEETE